MPMQSDTYLNALLSLPEVENTAVSPDGRWIAWSWLKVGPVVDIYMAPTDASQSPIRLTDAQANTELVSWTTDSRAVLVRRDHDGDERMQLFRIDIDQPEVMFPLTEEEPNFYLQGGQLHPNGRWLIYGANINEEGEEIRPTWIYRHDLATGERTVLARPCEPTDCDLELNLAGTHILYARQDRDPNGQQVWIVDVEGENDQEIVNEGDDVAVFASWLPDSCRVLVIANGETHRKIGIWKCETRELQWLIDQERNIEVAFVPPGPHLVAIIIEVDDARTHCSLLNLETAEEQVLPVLDGNLIPLQEIEEGIWVGQYYNSTQPIDLVRFTFDDVRPEAFISLTRVWERTDLRTHDLYPAQDFRWYSVDGLEVQGWLYQPEGLAQGTIVFVHGGPTARSEDKISPLTQFFVSQGFIVLLPNYRGSTGFGLAFQECIKEDGWGGREIDDIRTGIEALIAAGIAERGKVGITGASYGGYCAWCAITRWPIEVVAAAAPICGMTDLTIDYATQRPDIDTLTESMMGGSPDEIPERYHERSPINFVTNIKSKLLVVHGLQDPNVTEEQVQLVEKALQKYAIPYELLMFEDEGHGIYLTKNLKTLYIRLAKFFAEAFGSG